ncbi:hypothetical protein HDU92_004060 [Lobulomyces angularis]|nr:hypothetical protein HDU92_004060 [Lobulomyces angularis]
MTVLIDTGSSDLWVPSSTCRTNIDELNNCGPGYDNSTAKSPDPNLIVDPIKFSNFDGVGFLRYGDLSQADGILQNDLLSFGGKATTNVNFELVTREYGVDFLGNANSDENTITTAGGFNGIGIWGLGFPSNNAVGFEPVFQTLFNKSFLPENLYGLYLGDPFLDLIDGVLSLGEIDKTKFNEELKYIPVDPLPAALSELANDEWRIKLQSVSLGTTNLTGFLNRKNFDDRVLIDSGNSGISVPTSLYTEISKILKIDKDGMVESCKDISTYPSLFFVFNNQQFELNPTFFIKKISSSLAGVFCQVLIHDGGTRPQRMILGAPLLKSYYGVFDFGGNRIGLSPNIRLTSDNNIGGFLFGLPYLQGITIIVSGAIRINENGFKAHVHIHGDINVADTKTKEVTVTLINTVTETVKENGQPTSVVSNENNIPSIGASTVFQTEYFTVTLTESETQTVTSSVIGTPISLTETNTVTAEPVTVTLTESETQTVTSSVIGTPISLTVTNTVTAEPVTVTVTSSLTFTDVETYTVTSSVIGTPITITETDTVAAEPVTVTVTLSLTFTESETQIVTSSVIGSPISLTETNTVTAEPVTVTLTSSLTFTEVETYTVTPSFSPITITETSLSTSLVTVEPITLTVTSSVKESPVTLTKIETYVVTLMATTEPIILTETTLVAVTLTETAVETVNKGYSSIEEKMIG